ncbi:MAG TPA: amidohydrolase family protein, partial [Acidimicrobiales bacterium]|nr:amidohydrolase family protein [Acidimicrobiales bacterium]
LHRRAVPRSRSSRACGPPQVRRPEDLDRVLRDAGGRRPSGAWLRGVGHDDRWGGPLDRDRLDALVPDRPVRVQHRSGHLWILNSRALALAGPAVSPAAPDGRLYDADHLLHGLDPSSPADEQAAVAEVSADLARVGVTGITDATVTNDAGTDDLVAAWRTSGALRQRVHLLGGAGVDGARKLVLAEHDLPPLDDLVATIVAAHRAGRPVAVHAASRATVVLALAALDAAGVAPGDRLEHASVAPPETVAWIARLGVTVVTNPGFVVAHGDRYLDDVDPDDQPWLYRGRAFLDAGVALAAGSDAPFGPEDPWVAMQAAVGRRTESGARLGIDEGLTPEAALALYTGAPGAPGGPARRIALGPPADLCLLTVPWVEARRRLTADYVAATIVDGVLVSSRERS